MDCFVASLLAMTADGSGPIKKPAVIRDGRLFSARTKPQPLRNATLTQSGGPENGAMNAR
jgi:hypothetical protein